MALSSRPRVAVPALVVALLLAVAAVALPEDDPAAAAPPTPPGASALETLLRLHDLPLGYGLSAGGSVLFPVAGLRCDRVDPANAQPAVARFVSRRSPAGCLTLYTRIFKLPGASPEPLWAGSGALRLASPEAAEEGLAVAPLLLSHALLDELPEEVAPPVTVGDATRLFHWRHTQIFSEGEESCTFLVWRSGSTVAATFVSGGSPAANDRAATELAERQQRHIEAPTPYLPAEYDATEVALEDPQLQVPVYWLGKRFEPGRGLAPMRLQGSSSTTRPAPSAPRVGLFYADHPYANHFEGLFVDVYSPAQWRQLRSRGHALPGTLHCGASSHHLKLGHGGAVAFHGAERLIGKCRPGTRRVWTLRAQLGDAVVVVETTSICEVCASAGSGRYDSLAGMKAIARGLVLRPKPAG